MTHERHRRRPPLIAALVVMFVGFTPDQVAQEFRSRRNARAFG